MGLVINSEYKEVVNRIQTYDMSQFDKANLALEELSEAKDDNGDYIFDDYATITKAVLETFLNEEIEHGPDSRSKG